MAINEDIIQIVLKCNNFQVGNIRNAENANQKLNCSANWSNEKRLLKQINHKYKYEM